MDPGGAGGDATAAYFDGVFHQFRRSTSGHGVVSRSIALAGFNVQLHVCSGPMARTILEPFAHLTTADVTKPDLVLCAWDSHTTRSEPVRPGWQPKDYRREGFVAGFNDQRFHTGLQFDPLILRMIDMTEGRSAYWTPTASELPPWEVGAPMRQLLHEWLQRKGMVAVHGGAVGRPDGGLFLAGAGGRGKSNVALSCLASELHYASDDFCFLSRSPEWTVHSLYSTGKLAGGDLSRHPHLEGLAINPERPDGEKAIFYLNDAFGDRLIRSMPLRAVVLPRVIGSGQGAIVPISPDEAKRETAMSTIELSRWTGQTTLLMMTRMLGELPCYELQIGASIREVPILLERLLDHLQ